jgi:hypothetical protein
VEPPLGRDCDARHETDREQAFDQKWPAPDQSAWVTVLVIPISTAWLVIALFALTICRLAALSDSSHAVAWADWIAASHLAEHSAQPADSSAEQLSAADHHSSSRRSRTAPARAISGIRSE